MCRLAAYLGPARSLHDLWLAPPHNLVVQSYAPKEMNGALLNADGFGMAWYTDEHDEPALYRTVLPLWSDENVPRMAKHLVTRCAVANVRSATPGMAAQTSNVSPFLRGPWAVTHNGLVRDFRTRVLPRLRKALPDDAIVEGSTDSEHLAAILASHVIGASDPVAAIRRAMREIEEHVRDAGALLNFVLADGRSIYGVRHAIGGAAPSLYHRVRDDGGVEIASEGLDDRRWVPVDAGTIVFVDDLTVRSEAL